MVDAELVQRAKLLLDRLCENPRFAGSLEEARARELCRQELEKAGFACTDRPFQFSEWPARWGPPLSAAVRAATIILVARMALMRGPLSGLLVGAVLVAGLFFVDAHARRRWIKNFSATRSRSVNLEAVRGNPRVWLVAHLDSKSQTVPMLVRITGSVALALVMTLALAVLLLSLAGVDRAQAFWPALQIAAVLAALPVIGCFVTNRSTGAVDNSSGVVAVLLVSQSAASPRDLGVLLTSSEELGLAGAREWASTAPRELRVLNCDTVDDRGNWRCMYSGTRPQQITRTARFVADQLGAPMRVGRLIPGIFADSMAFSDKGIEAVTLSRGTLSTLARIHTRRDNSNRLTGKGAAETSALLSALARDLA